MRLRRRHRFLLLIWLAALLAGLAGAFVAARAAWRWQTHEMNSLLAEQLQAAQGLAQGLFSEAFARMDKVGQQWNGACDEQSIQALRNLVFFSATIREAQFLDANFSTVCSNYGVPTRGFTLTAGESAALKRDGTAIVWVPESAVMRTQAIAVNRVSPRGAVNVLIDPSFVDEALERDVIQPNMWSGLRLADGTIMAGSDKSDQGAAAPHILPRNAGRTWNSVSAAVAGVPVTAIASMEKPTLASVRRESWGLISGAGAVSAIAAFAVGYAILRRRLSLMGELKDAIANDDLVLHYQPLIELATRRCAGGEALIRWLHPERGMIRPDLFIPEAEDTGTILPMTDWVLRRIAADFAGGPPVDGHFHISINLTSRHFQMPDLVDKLSAVFGRSALKPQHIVLEATERQVMRGVEEGGTDAIAAIRQWGSAVSLDDFGTGYCGLKYLQQYRVNYLKIDKSFVDSIGTDAVSAHVVDAIIDLAKKLGIELVAEGVEREDQADYLKRRGVRYAQGYLFAKPMPLPDFLAFARGGRPKSP